MASFGPPKLPIQPTEWTLMMKFCDICLNFTNWLSVAKSSCKSNISYSCQLHIKSFYLENHELTFYWYLKGKFLFVNIINAITVTLNIILHLFLQQIKKQLQWRVRRKAVAWQTVHLRTSRQTPFIIAVHRLISVKWDHGRSQNEHKRPTCVLAASSSSFCDL